MEHPKDGLTAFGPIHDRRQPMEMRIGAVGTLNGLRYFKQWVTSIQGAVDARDASDPKYSMFPGFAATFRCAWSPEPVEAIEISDDSIDQAIHHADPYQAVYNTVGLFEERIRKYLAQEEATVAAWFVIIPEKIYEFGRPRSQAPRSTRINANEYLRHSEAHKVSVEPFFSFLDAQNKAADMHAYARNFRDQLKGRLLDRGAVVQVVRETTLAPHAFMRADGRPVRRLQDPADIAWNLATTAFYKAGGQPWRLDAIRPGVCYIGMVYKQLNDTGKQACCGAQMFLNSGDGLVFKGIDGPWYSSESREYHLDETSAKALMTQALQGYLDRHDKRYPKEIFIHGRARFEENEWKGFASAIPEGQDTKLVGVRIRRIQGRKLFRLDRFAALRGLVQPLSDNSGYLWTMGFVPRLQTYPGRELPNPLLVDICRGTADLRTVMADVLALTKVNFNACIYGDGMPVTLRFAGRVGGVLTAIPDKLPIPVLPFKHYI